MTIDETVLSGALKPASSRGVPRDELEKDSLGGRLAAAFEVDNGHRRLLPMEGLRGIAVFLVFLVHYYWIFSFLLRESSNDRIGWFLAAVGNCGVDLFFVMSGYLIYAAALRPGLKYGKFLGRRAQRIYPTFLVVLAIYLVVSFASPERSRIPAEPVNAAVYILQNALLLPGIFNIPAIITVAWSLSYEWLYYLLAPVLTLSTGMSAWTPRRRALLTSALTCAYLCICWIGWSAHPRLALFAAGILLYEAINSVRLPRLLSATGEKAAIALYIAGLIAAGILWDRDISRHVLGIGRGTDEIRVAILFVTTFLLALYSFAFNGVLSRFLSWTPLRYWGNISYSYYLLHGLTLHGVALAIPSSLRSPVLFWALLIPSLLVTIVVAAVLFVLVERPWSIDVRKPRQVRTAASGMAA